MVAKKSLNTRRTLKQNKNTSQKNASLKNKVVTKKASSVTQRKPTRKVNNDNRNTSHVASSRRSSRLAGHRNSSNALRVVSSGVSNKHISKRTQSSRVTRKEGRTVRNAVKSSASSGSTRTRNARVTDNRNWDNVLRVIQRSVYTPSRARIATATHNEARVSNTRIHQRVQDAPVSRCSSVSSILTASECSRPSRPAIDISRITSDSVTATTDRRHAKMLLQAIHDDHMVPSDLETKMCHDRWDQLTLAEKSTFYRLARLESSQRN